MAPAIQTTALRAEVRIGAEVSVPSESALRPTPARIRRRIAPFRLDQHIFFWLTQVVSRRDRQLAHALKLSHLRVFEWRVLASLRGRGPLSMGEVTDLAGVDRTTLSRTIASMVQRGLIARHADARDMRIARLSLTPAGTQLFAHIWPEVARLNDAALAGLPLAVVDLARWALGAMRDNLDAGLATGSRGRRRAT